MSEYRVHTAWVRTSTDFAYDTYNRSHEVTFGSGSKVPASAAPEYKGDSDRVNPEETFLAALSSCHMLTFLAIASKKGFVVELYQDDANCVLGKNETGALAVTHATLRPRITFSGKQATREDIDKMHASAHRNCFIASSVKTTIAILPQ